ncbi:hypothetical protein C8N43_3473 [Litoreibacter ponti]|uniref:Uncharacterized protein n=1 Tax=Litoreibacter ponti TaxID=1510457 RepID=A0A2T6BF22_9RHOB|nr:hypothetical protein [Litoreibacter ponti]PTX54656.1 hypothetical protein C8N43_3473 [Litoreibacter ponti]
MTELTKPDFDGAVAHSVRALGPFVQDGQLKTDVYEPSEFRLRFELQIKQGHDDQGAFYCFPEDADQALFELSAMDRGAFDLYCKIVASRLFRGQPLNFQMSVFAGLMVLQGISPPRASKKKSALFVAHSYIYWVALCLVQKFNISATSNDQGPGLSACNAISLALGELGHAKSPRAIKEILVGKSSAQLRKEAHDIWFLASDWRKDDPEQAAEWDRIHIELFGVRP